MKQTNRSLAPVAHPLFSGPAALSVILACIVIAALLSACNTTAGVGTRTGTTRIGASVGSTGGVTGVSASVPPGAILMTYQDRLFNGPTEIRSNNRDGLQALQEGKYDTAAVIFLKTLEAVPEHPDATFYLGVTRIYQNRREEGFELLKNFRDPQFYRMTAEVQRMAEFLEKEEDVTADSVHRTMLRYRIDGYNRDLRETRDTRTWD